MHRRGAHGIVAAVALCLGGGTSLVRAQSSPALVRQKQPAQPMRRSDVQKLTFPPRVWSYPLGSADPVLFGDHILVLEPSGRVLSFLSAQQGSAQVPASLCGTVNPEGPLPPGHSTMVDLSCVIERAVLTPGRHRFFLTYAHHGHALQTLAGSGDAFALWSEFTLPAPATPATPLPSPTAPAP